MSKLENVALSEIVLELYLSHFQIVTTLTIFTPPLPPPPQKKKCKKRHQEINHTSRTVVKKMNSEVDGGFRHRSQVGLGFVFTVSDSDSQFRIRKSNTKLEDLKAVLSCF